MNVIKPITINETNLLSSTIPEPDIASGDPAEWSAGIYDLGDRASVSSEHMIYEVVADPSTTDNPVIGEAKTPSTWVKVQPTNKYAMFDNINSTISKGDNIAVSIRGGATSTGLAGFAISTNSINVTCVSDSDGEIYNVDIDMNDSSDIVDWFTYFTEPFVVRDQFILTDLPGFGDVTTTVTLSGSDSEIGTLLMGKVISLGVAQYGTSWQGLDFSRREKDQFGNTVLSQGNTYDRIDYNVLTDRGAFGYVKKQLRELSGKPSVWIGNPSNVNDGTATFGYYVDNQVNIENPIKLDVSITVESFI